MSIDLHIVSFDRIQIVQEQKPLKQFTDAKNIKYINDAQLWWQMTEYNMNN